MVQTQRALTLACEAHEWAALDKKFRDLPPLDPILGEMRMAWLNNGRESLVWSSCIASRQYCNGNQQFRQIVVQKMGLPSGVCKPYVRQPVACKGQGRKLLDPHRHVLSTVSLPGGSRDIRHREIRHSCGSLSDHSQSSMRTNGPLRRPEGRRFLSTRNG